MLLRRRLLLLFVARLAGTLISAGVAGVLSRQRDTVQERERRAVLAREQVAQLATAYTDQETGERGYVLTGEESFLEPYNTGLRVASRLTRSLRSDSHERELLAPLATAVTSATRWRMLAAEPEIALRRAGDTEAAAAAIAGGQSLFDELRTRLDRLAKIATNAAQDATNELDDTRLGITAMVVLVFVIAGSGTLVAAWLIRRWITRPIDALAREVRRIRAGVLDSPLRSTGPPEIAWLASDIDAMRRRIDSQRAEAERSRLAVEQSAAVVLELRSQLEPDIGELPGGWTVAAQLRAAEGVVAGDCYDLLRIKDHHLALMVIDIAGHGATEGILALRCKELLRASLASDREPGDALAAAAAQLDDMGPEVFLTAFVAVIDTANGHVRYANAGHPPAFVVGSDRASQLGPTGPLVGLLSREWATAGATIRPGDSLCAYTDGLIEIRNGSGEFFGPDRLVGLLQVGACDEAPMVVKRCLDEVELFAPGQMRDDATIVILCRPEPV